MERLQQMIAGAEAKINRHNSYATFEDDRFQIYLTPVEQRTRAMKAHYRVGYYLLVDGLWKRTSKAVFVAEMEEEEIRKYADSQTTDEGFPLNPRGFMTIHYGVYVSLWFTRDATRETGKRPTLSGEFFAMRLKRWRNPEFIEIGAPL